MSKFLSLNAKDAIKGLVVAFFSAVLTGIYQLIQTGGSLTWPTIKPILITGVVALLGYLIKNVLTNSQDQLIIKEPKG